MQIAMGDFQAYRCTRWSSLQHCLELCK